MLTPEYIRRSADDLIALYDAVDQMIINDIARKLAKLGRMGMGINASGEAQARAAARITDDTIRMIAQASPYTEAELQKMFRKAAKVSRKADLKPLILSGVKIDLKLTEKQARNLKAAIKSTGNEISNLTGTLGTSASGKYREAVTLAYTRVQNGVSPQRATADAVIQAISDGNYVTYPSGHKDHLDVAVARASRTGISRTCGQITLDDCESFECKLVETSAHAGARPSHALWQGQIFSLDGSSRDYDDFYDATGYGEGDGLCGWNCRHSFYPFWEHISKANYDQDYLDWADDDEAYELDGTSYSEYEVSQMMRKDERAIRESKRQVAGIEAAEEAADDPAVKAMLSEERIKRQETLKRRQAKYKKLCADTNHEPQNWRTRVTAIQDDQGNILRLDRR